MILINPNDYVLSHFEVSRHKNKKYDAILFNKHNSKKAVIPFGQKDYQQFYDRLGYYKHLNHGDVNRRLNYRRRHAKDIMNKYSSGWFSYYYLW